MTTAVYLGNPPASIVDWIRNHSQPATRAITRAWWSNDESDFSDLPSNDGKFDDSCFTDGKQYYEAVKIEFGADVNEIKQDTFVMSLNLVVITISNTVKTIGSSAFNTCEGLTSVTIPDSVTSIGDEAFSGCSGLTNVTITSNSGNANNVKQMLINAGVPSNITWNMPS